MPLAIAPLDPNLKDWIQAASWMAAVAAGIFGIVKIVIELRLSRAQREQELRWRKAQAAKSLNDEMLADERSQDAMRLLDWDGREFTTKPNLTETITTPEMLKSLRTTNVSFSTKETFVRDTFDDYFYYISIFEHSIANGLVDFKDLEYPIEYYVAIMAKNRPVFENYLAAYGYQKALAFFQRFKSWRTAKPLPKPQPAKPPNPTLSRRK